ncbi:Ger(x)C family spore germination protein [Brevibacillus nitrificans]|uniref:Ger(x)C family spore germination protein n=1 Tax=Brevibacillus nitrificans TaxID=651560 RepID=UPI002615A581|nr:Ger(x)C family spore germination protein [Brevibacillus nitrificans]MED1792096.1 Ger(x)C family spore germination protein [Brevibacillus nitrificans]
MRKRICMFPLILVFISGCWDRVEVNDLAFVTGTALDLSESGNLICSLQIAIPASTEGGSSSGGSSEPGKSFILTAEGKNGNDIHRLLQKKSSRRLFFSHRGVVFISERLAKHGLHEALDVFTHDPRNRLKTYIVVVKGSEARKIFQIKYPLKQVSIEAVKEMEGSGDDVAVTLRDFFISLLSEGVNPVLGVIEPDHSQVESQEQLFKFAGAGVFKDLKLSGILDDKETMGLLWITNKLKMARVTAKVPKDAGEIGMLLTHAEGKIISQRNNDSVQFQIRLKGQGNLAENNSSLKIADPEDLTRIKNALEAAVKKQVQDLIDKIQNQYKVDCVGFGQEIYRSDPEKWRVLKNQWDTRFPKADISIVVDLTVNGAGMVNSTFELQQKENK